MYVEEPVNSQYENIEGQYIVEVSFVLPIIKRRQHRVIFWRPGFILSSVIFSSIDILKPIDSFNNQSVSVTKGH